MFHNSLFIKGGSVELAYTLKKAAESYGVEVATNSKVKSIETNQNSCGGVTLDNGEFINAKTVVLLSILLAQQTLIPIF